MQASGVFTGWNHQWPYLMHARNVNRLLSLHNPPMIQWTRYLQSQPVEKVYVTASASDGQV